MRSVWFWVFIVLTVPSASACQSELTRECSATNPCGTQGGIPGTCVLSPTSPRSWCAYEDSTCEGTRLRWGVLAGDGLDSQCVVGSAAAPHTVTVMKLGEGEGVVLSEPAGIACGSSCTASFDDGAQVVLEAQATAGSVFVGWEGACSGTGSCALELRTDTSIVARFGVPGGALWAQRFGGPGVEAAPKVAADLLGNLYVSGTFSIAFEVGGTLLSPEGDLDIFIIKLDAGDGHVLWARSFGGPERDQIVDLRVMPSGDLMVLGSFESTINLGAGPLASTGASDGFIARLAADDGSALWSLRLGGSRESMAGLAVDEQGDAYVAGSFGDDIDLGGGTRHAEPTTESAFIARYAASDGTYVWDAAYPCTGIAHGRAIALEPDGDPVVAGDFSGTIDLGDGPIVAAGRDTFIARLAHETGHLNWSQAVSGSGDTIPWSLVTDAAGTAWMAGQFTGSFDYAQTPHTAVGGSTDILLTATSATESPQHSAGFGGAADDIAVGVTLAGGMDPVIVGAFAQTLSFGGATMTAAGTDGFVARLGADGAPRWAHQLGGGADDVAFGVATDANGRIVVVGHFGGTATLGGANLTSAGDLDVFVVSLAP